MRDATLIITAWRRPDYLRRALASWAAVPELGDLRRVVVALGPSDQVAAQARVIREAAASTGREILIRMDSPACDEVPGEHRALGEAISAAFDQDPGCGFVVASSEDVAVSDDVLRYFAWARTIPGLPLAICAHNELGQGWHDPDADDDSAGQSAARLAVAFNPWAWGTWRGTWRDVFEPEWDWDATSGSEDTEHGWDWQAWRIVQRRGLAVTPEASRALNIGERDGVYAVPENYPRTVARSFREKRGDVAYRLVP